MYFRNRFTIFFYKNRFTLFTIPMSYDENLPESKLVLSTLSSTGCWGIVLDTLHSETETSFPTSVVSTPSSSSSSSSSLNNSSCSKVELWVVAFENSYEYGDDAEYVVGGDIIKWWGLSSKKGLWLNGNHCLEPPIPPDTLVGDVRTNRDAAPLALLFGEHAILLQGGDISPTPPAKPLDWYGECELVEFVLWRIDVLEYSIGVPKSKLNRSGLICIMCFSLSLHLSLHFESEK